jgi:preprotein translocase subunit SecE
MFKKIAQFYSEVKSEMVKVSWPSKDEAIGSTVIVLVVVAILSVFIGVVDVILNEILTKLIVGK